MKDGKMGLIKYGPMPGEDEPLHAYISGATAEIVAQAVEKVSIRLPLRPLPHMSSLS